MKDYKYAIYIGRFQPFHNGHEQIVKFGLAKAEKLIILVGSANSARSLKNPFTFEERKEFILDSIDPLKVTVTHDEMLGSTATTTESLGLRDNIIVLPLNDYFYSENQWITEVQRLTDEYIVDGDSVALIGNYKDTSSYYLSYFPQWEFLPFYSYDRVNATDVRNIMFDVKQETHWADLPTAKPKFDFDQIVPKLVEDKLELFFKTRMYRSLCLEYEFIQKYKEDHKFRNEKIPYDPVFVTVDTVVICSGHILLVQRKFNPGRNLYALPGGFIKSNERMKDAAIRELKEETGIKIDKALLHSYVVSSDIFDYPDRSARGRVITNAFYLKLPDGKLPEVRGNDDAAKAFWIPLAEVAKKCDSFFEDHYHIINKFIYKT